MVVALAALEAKLIGPTHKVFCRGFTQLGNARFHCWKKHGHGAQDMYDALKNSCDVYFYDITSLGRRRPDRRGGRIRMEVGSGVDLPSEKGGVVPTRA